MGFLKKQKKTHSYSESVFNNIASITNSDTRIRNLKNKKNIIVQEISEKQFLVNLQLIGIGYRAFVVKPKKITENSFEKFLVLKVGQSGTTMYPIPNDVDIQCPVDAKADKEPITLTSNNLQSLQMATAQIKSYRRPDPYKGSGILKCDRIQTKTGEIFKTEFIIRKEIKKKK